MTSPFRRDPAKKRRPTRLRIFVWALIISGIVGLLELTMPIEDIYRGGRNYLRMHPADQSVVVVAIDDRTVRELGSLNYSRTNDVKLVETLLAQGARRIYYDKAFADPVDVAGTVSRGLFVVTNATEPGLLRVVIYGAMPIDEDGVLLNLRFTAVGKSGSVSHLTFERIMFNEGEPRVMVSEGRVEISY